jgi:hypothetical protein
MMQNEYFKTTDLSLASFLLAKGIEFVGINKDSTNRATFLFTHSSECVSLVAEFTQMKAIVEPSSFSASMKRLKQLLYLDR